MSRIRTIKPEFWSSEQIVACSHSARLLFIGTLNFCDDAGRKPASLMRLKMEVLPGDDISTEIIGQWVNELIANQLLREYSVDGKKYWQVTGWHHQKIDKPTIKYPPPDAGVLPDHSPNNNGMVGESSESAHPRSLMETSGMDSKDICQSAPAPRLLSSQYVSENKAFADDLQAIFDFWRVTLNHPNAVLDSKRKRVIQQALKQYDSESLKLAIQGCSRSEFHLGKNDQHKKYDDITLILRNATNIESFIAQAQNQSHSPSQTTINNSVFEGAL